MSRLRATVSWYTASAPRLRPAKSVSAYRSRAAAVRRAVGLQGRENRTHTSDSADGILETFMSERPVILIADGMPNTLPEMDRVLGALGYETLIANNVSSVLSITDQMNPVAMLLGLHLPGGGPLTAMREQRASAHGASIPVIGLALSGQAKQALLAAGVDRCLAPPVREEDIVAALTEFLGAERGNPTSR